MQTANEPKPRYTVPLGTPCEVTPIRRIDWQPHVTTRDCQFQYFEAWGVGLVTFRQDVWLLRVPVKAVKVRRGGTSSAPPPSSASEIGTATESGASRS